MHLWRGPNSAADELYPSIDRAGNLYFGSNRDADQWDVWRSQRLADGSFAPAVKLGSGGEHGRLLGVQSGDLAEREDAAVRLAAAAGRLRLGRHLPQRPAQGWPSAGANLGPCVNSSADDYHPTMLWEEGELIYIRNFIEDPDWYPDFFIIPLDLD